MLPLASFPLSAASLLDTLSSILSNMLPIEQAREEEEKFSWVKERKIYKKYHTQES